MSEVLHQALFEVKMVRSMALAGGIVMVLELKSSPRVAMMYSEVLPTVGEVVEHPRVIIFPRAFDSSRGWSEIH